MSGYKIPITPTTPSQWSSGKPTGCWRGTLCGWGLGWWVYGFTNNLENERSTKRSWNLPSFLPPDQMDGRSTEWSINLKALSVDQRTKITSFVCLLSSFLFFSSFPCVSNCPLRPDSRFSTLLRLISSQGSSIQWTISTGQLPFFQDSRTGMLGSYISYALVPPRNVKIPPLVRSPE